LGAVAGDRRSRGGANARRAVREQSAVSLSAVSFASQLRAGGFRQVGATVADVRHGNRWSTELIATAES
jgi:hypothetical protein